MGTSLITKFADKFGIEPDKMLKALTETAFKQKNNAVITQEQMMALLVVANEYGLNPWTKEIYAFPTKGGGIVPIVGVDGWCRIINDNPNFNGMGFNQSTEIAEPSGGKKCPEWMECSIHRKDRSHPIVVREYIDEVYRPPFEGKGNNGSYKVDGPWQSHTKRMLRHKVMIQCARLAFGFSGVYDQDEGERIIEGEIVSDEINEDLPDLDKADPGKIRAAINFFKNEIDKCEDFENYKVVQAAWERLNQNECILVHKGLYQTPKDSKKKYKSILSDYLKYAPEEIIHYDQ